MADISNKKVVKLWNDIDLKLKHNVVDDEISGDLTKTKYKGIDPAKIGVDVDFDPDNKRRDVNYDGSYRQYHLVKYLSEDLEKERHNRIARYDRMKKALEEPEIAGALNIYADEACTEDMDYKKIHVQADDQEVREIIEELFDRIGIEDKIWSIARDMCGYGDNFTEIIVNSLGNGIHSVVNVPRKLIERVEKNGVLQGFKPIQPESDFTEPEFAYYKVNVKKDVEQEEKEIIPPFRVLHWRIESSKYSIYGESILEPILDTIEQLRIMEKAMLIGRVSRAPERRIYNINVGRLVGEKALQYARMAVQHMFSKKRVLETATSEVNTVKDAFSYSEEYLLPFRQGEEKNAIETLPSANNLGDIQDVEFFRDRIFPGLGIPRQYLFDDTFANANLNLSSKSIPFAKRIRRVQRFLLYNLYKLARIELKLKGKANFKMDKFTITMNNPSTINEKEMLEIETNKWTLVTTIKSLNAEQVFYPDYYLYSKYLDFSDDEIVELFKLSQLQQAGQNIFNAFEVGERPEGAEDLDFAPAGGAAGGAPGAAPAGGGGLEGGGEEEIPPEAEEALGEPPAEGGGEAPAPAPETADVHPEEGKEVITDDEKNLTPQERAMLVKQRFLNTLGINAEGNPVIQKIPKTIEEKRAYAKEVKNQFLDAYNETTQKTIELMRENELRREEAKRTKSSLGALSYMENTGDLNGIAKYMNDHKLKVYEEKLEDEL